jgi:5-methyltetrahydropteroyltriglutamate--homocysteine methyltransferase
MWGFDGVGHTPTKTGLPFHGEDAMVDDTYLVGKVGIKGEHPFVEHFKFVKQFEDENTVAKQTMPSPAQFLAQFTMPFNREHTLKYYATDKELAEDIVKAYGKVINDLY